MAGVESAVAVAAVISVDCPLPGFDAVLPDFPTYPWFPFGFVVFVALAPPALS